MSKPDMASQIEHPALSPEREGMTRGERIKHDVARQFALGPFGDPAVSGIKFRRDPYSRDINDHIPMSASVAESTDPFKTWDTQVIDPHSAFANSQEFALLVRQYRSELDPETAIRIEQEEEQIALGKQRQEEIWAMEIAARDRRLLEERNKTLATQEEPGEAPSQDVFVAEGFSDQRAA